MERQIRYRGYNLKNKKWIYGYYFVNRGKHFIADDGIAAPGATWEDFEVDAESVGQYVGDYKGVPIFEGDEVLVESYEDEYMHYIGIVGYDKLDSRFVVNLKVQCGLKQVPITGEKQRGYKGIDASYDFYYKYKVIGNEYEKKIKGNG